jgi:hypothetical protein
MPSHLTRDVLRDPLVARDVACAVLTPQGWTPGGGPDGRRSGRRGRLARRAAGGRQGPALAFDAHAASGPAALRILLPRCASCWSRSSPTRRGAIRNCLGRCSFSVVPTGERPRPLRCQLSGMIGLCQIRR